MGTYDGLKAASRRTDNRTKFQLRGPAGLFKSFEKHRLCWGLLNFCNSHTSTCPIDIITFHRKGINSSDDILTNSIDLIETIEKLYPNLNHLSYANTEADPTSGWSKNVSNYANVQYAHTLISIVFQHWNAYFGGILSRLESISHDNAFLSYHPFEFEQRTMLARFLMNETHPKTVQFIEKPVYAALGLLSSLAWRASNVFSTKNVTYLLSMGKYYSAVLLISDKNAAEEINIKLDVGKWHTKNEDFQYGFIVEYLHQNRTDPFAVWTRYGKPSYPNDTVIADMHQAQVHFSTI